MNPYEIGETGTYPCGCSFIKTTEGFNHIVSSDCDWDKNKIGKEYKGYKYIGKEINK